MIHIIWIQIVVYEDKLIEVSMFLEKLKECLSVSTCQLFPACVLNCFSLVQLFRNLWTVDCQAPLSMGFSRQEYWSGLPCPPPGDLPNQVMEPAPHISCIREKLAGQFFTLVPPGKP